MPSTLLNFIFTSLLSLASANGIVLSRDDNATAAADCDEACSVLAEVFPSKVFYAGSSVYAYENSQFWSNVEILDPMCIFRPTCASDVATGIKVLKASSGSFAVRGGGHMGIKGSNNIDDGVLMVLSNLTTMSLSSDERVLSLGPSHRWGDVYKWLSTYDLAVPGGRLSPVGVPGLLLAGGVNFYGNQVGWSADNVIQYEVVLASGSIVYANKSSYSDLFWALKGGSSNFGIVTRFDIKTVPSTKVFAGIYSVGNDDIPAFVNAIANYSANIKDPLSHIVPATVPTSRNPATAIGAVILFYDSATNSNPACFQPFFDIPSISSTMAFKTLAEFADETGTAVVGHINDVFAAGTIVGTTYDQLQAGVNITQTVFSSRLPLLYAEVPAANISIIEFDWQPIGKLWMDATTAAGGNALGLDPTKIYLCWAEVVEWIGSAYDDVVASWVKDTTAAINAATTAAGVHSSFTYMGDSTAFQTSGFFAGYGSANQAKLLGISRKYDPERLFQTLMPGGFKIGS